MELNRVWWLFLIFLVGVESFSVEYRTEESPFRNKRFIGQPNKNYQECQTPNGSPGHCKHTQHCSWSALQNQTSLNFLGYMCVIESSSIGVCCPDRVNDTIISAPDFSRPRQAYDDHIVWDRVEDSSEKIDRTETTTARIRPEERGCGLSTKSFPKIVGGRPADPKEWPWMAALLRRNTNQSTHCGGVVVTDRAILTAAHCTYSYNKNDLTVRLGEYKFSTPDETRSRDFRIIDIRHHAEYDESTYENDIAIAKLHKSILFNSYIWPVCMPPPDDTFEGMHAMVLGWGAQDFGSEYSDVLMEVSVPIWKNDDCQNSFVERIGAGMICGGEGGRDSCQGDSGGPLLVQLKNKRWITVGIVSWGIYCGDKDHPGVYTRVTHYLPWIMENALF